MAALKKEELACVYAALVMMDDDIAVTGDKIATLLKAANVTIEPFWPSLFARALEGIDAKDLLNTIGSAAPVGGGGGAAPAAATSAAPAAGGKEAAPAKKEEKKKEEEVEEGDDDMGLSLFD